MNSLTLSEAQSIVAETLAAARATNARPLAVVVLDAGGHSVASAREDGASLFRHTIARAKALGALGMGMSSRAISERAKENPAFFQSVAAAVGGEIAFSPGGVLLATEEGHVRGAVGVSGDTGDRDEECVLSGISNAGLRGGR